MTDQIELLVRQLKDLAYIEMARLKLEGYTNEQIAQAMGISIFTVYHKLRILRR